MKSLFRTTIHRDERRTMTASAAEMRRWRLLDALRRREKKRAGDEGYPSERLERVVVVQAGKQAARGRVVEKHVRQHTPHSVTRSRVRSFVRSSDRSFVRSFDRSFVRSFVRWFVRFFVMTVDETMTYFSGFSLPGCPAALPFRPYSTSLLLCSDQPPHPCPDARMHARLGCIRLLSPRPEVSRAFFFVCRALFLTPYPPRASFPRA